MRSEQIPYGVKDFKRIRLEDLYYVDKTAFSHPCGFSDYALFPNRMLPEGSIPEQSYVIEMKHSKADTTDAELAAKHAEAVAQLKAYAADPNLPALAAGTPVHFLCYEFKGRELVCLEEVTDEVR